MSAIILRLADYRRPIRNLQPKISDKQKSDGFKALMILAIFAAGVVAGSK